MLNPCLAVVIQHGVADGQVLGTQMIQVVADRDLRVGGQIHPCLFDRQSEAVQQFRQLLGSCPVILTTKISTMTPATAGLEGLQQGNGFPDAQPLEVDLFQTTGTSEVLRAEAGGDRHMHTTVLRQHTHLGIGQQLRLGHVVEDQQHMTTGGAAPQLLQHMPACEFRITLGLLGKQEAWQVWGEPGQQGQHLPCSFCGDLPDASRVVAPVPVSVVPDQLGFTDTTQTPHRSDHTDGRRRRQHLTEPGEFSCATHEPGRAARQIPNTTFPTATVLSLLIQVIAQVPDPGLRALQGWGGITGEHILQVLTLHLRHPGMPVPMLLIGLILFGCVLQQHRHQPFPGIRARRFDLVLLEFPQTEVALEIGFGHTRHEHLGLANRPRQLGLPLLPGPQIMTIKEHLEPVIKNLPGLPAQRLHQLLHPPRGIIPAGITHKYRIPGISGRGGELRIR